MSLFRAQSHYNLHVAGDRGAQGRRSESRVELRREAEGRVTVEDAGEAREYVSDASGLYRERTVRWRHRYAGVWTSRRDGARLALTVRETSCEREETSRGSAAVTTPCEATVNVALSCTMEAAPRAFHCVHAASPAGEGHTSAPWAFAEPEGCVERSGGAPMTGPPVYEACSP